MAKSIETMNKRELEAYAKDRFGVDLARNLSLENLRAEVRVMEGGDQDDTPSVRTEAPPPKDAKWPADTALPVKEQERLVQTAAKLIRRDKVDPSTGALANHAKRGLVVTDAEARAAVAEARARSATLDQYEIVEKARWP